MKNSRLLWLAVLGPIVLLAVLFLSINDFAQSLKQVSEMLRGGNASSLQMFYYDGGNLSWLVSILITIYASLVPLYPKSTVIVANQSYFGELQGGMLVATGMLLAASYAIFLLYGIAKACGICGKCKQSCQVVSKQP